MQLQTLSPDAEDLYPGYGLYQDYLDMKLPREQLLDILSMEDDCVEEAIAQTPYGKAARENRLAYEEEVERWFRQRQRRSREIIQIVPPPQRARPPRPNRAMQVKAVRLGQGEQRSLNKFVHQIQSTDFGQVAKGTWKGVTEELKSIKPTEVGMLLTANVQKGVRAPRFAPVIPI